MKKFLSKINQADSLALAGKMYLIFLLQFFNTISHHYLILLILWIVVYATVEREFLLKIQFWFPTFLLLLISVYSQQYITANHSYVALYIAAIFCLASFFRNWKKEILYTNAKYLLGIIMGFAVIQKLLSKEFMQGEGLAFINYGGGFFPHFQRFFPENQAIINSNLQLINEQASSVENLQTQIELVSPNWIVPFDTDLLVWFVIGIEVLFCVLLFVKNQYLRNLFLLGFMLALIGFRIETGFASLLCVLLFLQAQKDRPIFKLGYIIIFALFISMILTKLGVL